VAGRTIQGTSRDANDNERVVFGATNGQCAIGTLVLKGETPSEIERGAAAARASMSGPVGVNGGAAPVPSASLGSPTNATVPQAGGAEAYFAKGKSYFGAKDFANAAYAYREALRVRPNYPEASVWLSLSLMGMKKFPEAQTALQQAIRLQPNHPLLHYSLGLVDLKLGRREEAMQEYRTLQRLHPDGAKALYAVITAPKQ
jgi:Flp pilus assembly protein TadD